MMKAHASCAGQAFERTYLFEQQQLQLVCANLNRRAPEIAAAPRSRMRAQPRALEFRKSDAGLHRALIAGVAAAGDVRRRDPTHQRVRPAERFAFAQVAVEVQFQVSVHAIATKRPEPNGRSEGPRQPKAHLHPGTTLGQP